MYVASLSACEPWYVGALRNRVLMSVTERGGLGGVPSLSAGTAFAVVKLATPQMPLTPHSPVVTADRC